MLFISPCYIIAVARSWYDAVDLPVHETHLEEYEKVKKETLFLFRGVFVHLLLGFVCYMWFCCQQFLGFPILLCLLDALVDISISHALRRIYFNILIFFICSCCWFSVCVFYGYLDGICSVSS